jgi:hypothetical protein
LVAIIVPAVRAGSTLIAIKVEQSDIYSYSNIFPFKDISRELGPALHPAR